jgi:hypothetical protein
MIDYQGPYTIITLLEQMVVNARGTREEITERLNREPLTTVTDLWGNEHTINREHVVHMEQLSPEEHLPPE